VLSALLGKTVLLFALNAAPDYLDEVASRWEPLGLEVNVATASCGQENAYYFGSLNLVVMCKEVLDRPALASWILNHELAHAAMDQLELAEDDDPEFMADELAALMSTADETFAAAVWFMAMGPTPSGDTHPSGLDRAGAVLCLLEGSDPKSTNRSCRAYYRSATQHWIGLLT
jgi:hypothetical protein